MASLTATNLRTRMSVSPRGWQFEDADNPYDLNWLTIRLAVKAQKGRNRVVTTRVVVWELADVAGICTRLAAGTRSNWHSRLLDSGLHLNIRRTSERSDVCRVMALASTAGGALPADFKPYWDDDWLAQSGAAIWGVRMTCSRAALSLFAAELESELAAWPPRPWRRPDTGTLEMPASARQWAEKLRAGKVGSSNKT